MLISAIIPELKERFPKCGSEDYKIIGYWNILLSTLSNNNLIPLKRLNAQCQLLYRLIGSLVVPISISKDIEEPTLVIKQNHNKLKAIILLPRNYITQIESDICSGLGKIAYLASKVSDYWSFKQDKYTLIRARANEAVFYHLIKDDDVFLCTSYQDSLILEFPSALDSKWDYDIKQFDYQVAINEFSSFINCPFRKVVGL